MTTVFQNFFFFFLFFALGLEIHTLLDLGRFESQCWPFSFKFLWFSSWFKNHDSWKPSLCCAQSSWSFDILLTVDVIILLQQLEFGLFFLPLEARPPNVDDYCPLPAPPELRSGCWILRWAPAETSEGSLQLAILPLAIQRVPSWAQSWSTPSCSGRTDSQPPWAPRPTCQRPQQLLGSGKPEWKWKYLFNTLPELCFYIIQHVFLWLREKRRSLRGETDTLLVVIVA